MFWAHLYVGMRWLWCATLNTYRGIHLTNGGSFIARREIEKKHRVPLLCSYANKSLSWPCSVDVDARYAFAESGKNVISQPINLQHPLEISTKHNKNRKPRDQKYMKSFEMGKTAWLKCTKLLKCLGRIFFFKSTRDFRRWKTKEIIQISPILAS